MDLQLRQLQALVAVVDAGTFTDAAASLGVSQAAVSRSVAGLEAALEVRLVDRTTRHTALTPVGVRVLPLARQVLADVDRLRRVAGEADSGLRVGFPWSALGRHTRTLQRDWDRRHPAVPLAFVQSNTPTAGLGEGIADVAIVRRSIVDERFDEAEVGVEARYAAVSTDHTLARRRNVRLSDLGRYTIAIDDRTGTTTLDLWTPDIRPVSSFVTRGVDEWLTLIATGRAVGLTSEATAHQYPRPGVAFRPVRDAAPITVRLAWWRSNPPRHLMDLITLTRQVYRHPDGTSGHPPPVAPR